MSYRLIYTQRAVRDIKKINFQIKKRIADTLIRYKMNPFKYAEHLTNSAMGHIDSG